MKMVRIILAVWLWISASSAFGADLLQDGAIVVVSWQAGEVRFVYLDEKGARGIENPKMEAPLGSLWKLFVYAFLLEEKHQAAPYVCKGVDKQERFCCEKGGILEAEDALVQSCGLFFGHRRLGILPNQWRNFWRAQGVEYPWLMELASLGPETKAKPEEILQVLHRFQLKGKAYPKLRRTLGRVLVDGTAKAALEGLGGIAKIKTYTWDHPTKAKEYVGGFAGWLQQGTPVWGMGIGTSSQILKERQTQLANYFVSLERMEKLEGICVKVKFFAKYPFEFLLSKSTGKQAHSGLLEGSYQVVFNDKVKVLLESEGNMQYSERAGEIIGSFSMNEYVARVLDREVASQPTEAAKAFAIAIRSYVLINGKKRDGCYEIPDSTHFQRVSAAMPTHQSLVIARWTDQLIIKGVPGLQYHAWRERENRMSWSMTAKRAREGKNFITLLKGAYPKGRLSVMRPIDVDTCIPHPEAAAWLEKQKPYWQSILLQVKGFEPPKELEICKLHHGKPFAEPSMNRVFLYEGTFKENRMALIHEYLHFGLLHHPLGLDEAFIERLAKRLYEQNSWNQVGDPGQYGLFAAP